MIPCDRVHFAIGDPHQPTNRKYAVYCSSGVQRQDSRGNALLVKASAVFLSIPFLLTLGSKEVREHGIVVLLIASRWLSCGSPTFFRCQHTQTSVSRPSQTFWSRMGWVKQPNLASFNWQSVFWMHSKKCMFWNRFRPYVTIVEKSRLENATQPRANGFQHGFNSCQIIPEDSDRHPYRVGIFSVLQDLRSLT